METPKKREGNGSLRLLSAPLDSASTRAAAHVSVRSGKLSFLHYDGFEGYPDPLLLTRIKINPRNQFVQVFDHSAAKKTLLRKQRFT